MDQSNLSVILSNYNHGHFLRQQLDALATQSVKPMEIIVIDDGSTDDSLKVAQEAAAVYPFIRILKNDHNIGIYSSIMRAMKEVRGSYLFFASANDRVLPDLFKKSIEQLERHPAAAVCTAMVQEIDEDGVEIGLRQQPLARDTAGYISPDEALKNLYRHDAWFQGCTAVFRRSMLEDIGGFDPRIESFMDAFLCTAMSLRYGVCFIPEPLACFRIHNDSYSKNLTSNVEHVLNMFAYAKDQMEGTFKDIFPNNYISLWERRWRYTISSNLVKGGEKDSKKLMMLMPNFWLLDSFMFRALQVFGPMRIPLINLYLLLRLTPRDLTKITIFK